MKKISIYATTGKLGKSILLALPMFLFIFSFLTQFKLNFSSGTDIIAFSITFLYFCYLFFMILYTGKTDIYRAIGIIVFALFFSFTLIVNLFATRGSNTISNEMILSCKVPICHLVVPMFIIPAALTKTIIYPGNVNTIAFIFVMTIVICITMGRAFCSWICPFGGWDEGASRILRKPVIKKINTVFRWVSFAILLIVVLWSAIALSPTFCWWLCPFKAVTEYEAISSYATIIKTVVFISIFLGLTIILPLLTKKRIQCTTFCPMGAFISFFNKISIFDVRIDKEKCNKCRMCAKTCPTLSIDQSDIEKTRPSITCTKCGKCIDICNKYAIQYHIKGTSTGKNISLSRYLFIYPAFLLLLAFSGYPVQNGIVLIIRLITTGNLL